jgi:predicted GIY-YIG superfamily endonuclease
VKDDMGPRTPGVYSMPCACIQVYIGQTGRSIETRIKQHNRHIQLGHADKSAMAEHRLNHDHIKFQDTQILSTKSAT